MAIEDPSNMSANGENIPPLADDMSPEALAFVIGHCSEAAVATFPTFLSAISDQGTLHPTPPEHKEGDPYPFEFAEHRFLGDSLALPEHDSANTGDKAAKYNPLTLKNGLKLTYGQINGLAGDFFGADEPICEGSSPEERKARFQAAFRSLAEAPTGKTMADKLNGVLQAEVDAVNDALKNGKSVEEAYHNMEDVTFKLQAITEEVQKSSLTYLELAKKNLDHFGEGGRRAYDAGHSWALEVASAGTKEALLEAYAINAFADHFLEDSFASGHLRVPRGKMMDGVMPNLCAKLMHDEDNRMGVFVTQPDQKKSWTEYGDKHLFNDENKANMEQCFLALKASVDEVHQIYKTPTTKPQEPFKAWSFAASAESSTSQHSNAAPLFRVFNDEIYHRKVLTTVDATDRNELSKQSAWDMSSYEPVVTGKWKYLPLPGGWSETICWAYLAYNLAPPGSLKDYVKSWLEKYLPSWVVDSILG